MSRLTGYRHRAAEILNTEYEENLFSRAHSSEARIHAYIHRYMHIETHRRYLCAIRRPKRVSSSKSQDRFLIQNATRCMRKQKRTDESLEEFKTALTSGLFHLFSVKF
jgi:hypothetical protein